VNDSAVAVLGDDTLKTIARELVQAVRRNVIIDWTLRESVRGEAPGAREAGSEEARVSA
jgi:type I restriction enzyme, R subunit